MREFVAHGDGPRAARAAGYRHPEAMAHQVRHRPAIAAEIYGEQMARLVREGVPLAVATLTEIAGSPTAKHSDRITASRVILERADVMVRDSAAGQRDLAEMTRAELERAIAETTRRLAVIEAEPAIVDSDDAEGDFFD